MDQARFANLTQRQRECLAQVVRGRSSKEIGRDLGISGATVDTHIDTAMQRTGYRSRYDLARDLAEAEGRPAPTLAAAGAATADQPIIAPTVYEASTLPPVPVPERSPAPPPATRAPEAIADMPLPAHQSLDQQALLEQPAGYRLREAAPVTRELFAEARQQRSRAHEHIVLRKFAQICAITAALAIILLAASPLGESFQRFANYIQPPHSP